MSKADNKIMNSTCSLPDDFRKSVNEHAEDELKVFDHQYHKTN